MIDHPLFTAGAALIVVAALVALGTIAFVTLRTRRRDDAEAAQQQMSELARLQVETSARLGEMRDMLAGRQAELARVVSDRQAGLTATGNKRLDAVTHHLSQSMTATRQHTSDHLSKLNERLAVIDGAQKNITDLA